MTHKTAEFATARRLFLPGSGPWRRSRVLNSGFVFVVGVLLLLLPGSGSDVWAGSLETAVSAQSASQEKAQALSSDLPKAIAGARRVEKEPRVLLGPDGKPLPFKTAEEVLDFLRTAAEKERKPIGEGITGANRLLLEKDGVQMHAIFRDVKVFEQRMRLADGTTHFNFRDDAIFECAAFELNRLLGLYIIPAAVERSIKSDNGTVQVWLEGTMMEKERLEKKIEPPDPWKWNMQRQVMHVFDNLIYNEDRNQGNILITKDWLLVLIDHTRAFRDNEKLLPKNYIRYCDRNLLENMKRLDLQMLQEHLGKYLHDRQIRAILKRRDLIVEYVDKLIKEHGSGDVLFSFFR